MTGTKELHEPWYSALVDAGLVSPSGEPSLRRLADLVDAHVSTVSRTVKGTNAKGPSPELLRKIAKALNKPVAEVASWTSETWDEVEDYVPPAGASTLTFRQRETVDRIIRAFVEVNRRDRKRRATDSELIKKIAKSAGQPRSVVADWFAEAEKQ